MFGTTDFVVVAVVPLLVSTIVFALVVRSPAHRDYASLAAIGVGFVLGAIAMVARDLLPLQPEGIGTAARWQRATVEAMTGLFRPHEARRWLPLLAMLGMLLAYVDRGLSKWRLVLWSALFVALPVRLLWGSVYFSSSWSAVGSTLRVTAIAASMLAVFVVARRRHDADSSEAANAKPSVDFLFISIVVSVGAAAVLLLTGSKTYGELAGVFCGALLGAFAGANVVKDVRHENATGLVTLIFAGLLVLGCSFAETRLWQAIALSVSAGVPLVVSSRAGCSRRQRLAIMALMIVVVLGICVHAAWQFSAAIRAEANPYGQYN